MKGEEGLYGALQVFEKNWVEDREADLLVWPPLTSSDKYHDRLR